MASPTKSQAQDPPARTSDHQVNILLVDDKPERLLSYEVALEILGHNLVRAQSGTEALGLLMKMDFAAILLDVSMPEMDGFETAGLIRDHPRFEDTPIIFVTGVHVTDFDRRKGYEMGAVDYVQIPVIPEILRGKVQALVQLYIQRAQLFQLNQQLATTNAELAKAHEELKLKNTRELQQLNQTLERANSELVASNSKLVQEISERERAEKALFESARRKDEYIAILAHELRNPLSAIHNAAQVMQLQDASVKQLDWAKELLQRQVNHLTCLMDDLLDVSRISNGRIQLRLEILDLNTVVQHAAEMVMSLLTEHSHKLQLNLTTSNIFVRGDSVRLNQILCNLLTNAAKYMDDGGEIILSLEQQNGDTALIKVKDHGVGIPDELLHSVFDLFVQLPTALNRAQGGLGIGLALVQTLVELHGGTTEVRSEGAGRGAEFLVRLPLVKGHTQPTPPPKQLHQADNPQLQLLIIDDNVDSADGLAMCLRSKGYELQVCYTGEDGVSSAKLGQPDVILLDIALPGIDGFEVARQLRQDPHLVNTCIIAMSGFSGEAEHRHARSAGFDHYLVKPVDFGELLDLLNRQVKPLEEV